MSKKQRYSLKFIRRNYTYSVDEVAELYGIAPETVFRWIRNEGLYRVSDSRKYFVHSSELIKFLEKRNSKNKQPCQEGEIYCCKCRKPRKPKRSTLKFKKIINKTVRVSGECSICGTRTNTVVSGKKWSKTHPFYPDQDAPTIQHSGEHQFPRKCQVKEEEQLCLDIIL